MTARLAPILATLAGVCLLAEDCRALGENENAATPIHGNLLTNGGFEELGEGAGTPARGWESTGGPTLRGKKREGD